LRQSPVLLVEERSLCEGDTLRASTLAGNERDMATDRETFLALLDRHGAVALGMLRRLCGNGHDADDVFQDVAVRVWKHLGERPRLRDDRAWLLTITYRAFLDDQTRRPPVHAPLFDDDEPLATSRTDSDPVAVAERAERAALVNEAVAGLSPPLREVVVLHYTGGLSLRQVATTMGVSIGTVKSRLNAGLEQLRRRMP
jgi:RNA polymerase sigma-70 factor (ECF subfamily)